MTQSRLGSLYEALINVAIGYGINFTANLLVFPLFGWHISVAQNLLLGSVFTFISVARTYLIRRYFNNKLRGLAMRLAGDTQ